MQMKEPHQIMTEEEAKALYGDKYRDEVTPLSPPECELMWATKIEDRRKRLIEVRRRQRELIQARAKK